MHFPTDVNLLWDAARKCLNIVETLVSENDLKGWRKHKYWLKKIRNQFMKTSRIMFRGGRNRETRLQESVLGYLDWSVALSEKIKLSKDDLKLLCAENVSNGIKYNNLLYYEEMLDKHIDLVRRRVIFKEKIPHKEKVFSLFETFTRWINKGKSGGRVELGLPVSICSDQYGFILHHHVMEKEADVNMAVPLARKLLSLGHIESLSFDKGFWSPSNYHQLCSMVKKVILPKKGRLSKDEMKREKSKAFIRLRHHHSAVESDINALEHHGLNRCPDKGLAHFKRYTALGVLALNLHRLGNILLETDQKAAGKKQAA